MAAQLIMKLLYERCLDMAFKLSVHPASVAAVAAGMLGRTLSCGGSCMMACSPQVRQQQQHVRHACHFLMLGNCRLMGFVPILITTTNSRKQSM
jgi:uncharacterized membrane protein YadS